MNKKIAFIVNEFPAISETFVLNQIILCIHEGFDVTIVTRSKGDLNRIQFQVKDYSLLEKTIFIPPVPKNIIQRFGFILKSYYRIKSFDYYCNSLKLFNFVKFGYHSLTLYIQYNFIYLYMIKDVDIIHAHFGHSGKFINLYKRLRLFKDIPVIVSFHGVDLSPNNLNIYKKQYKSIFNHSSHFIVNNSYSQFLLRQINSSIHQPVSILPVGVDVSFFRPNKKNKSENSSVNIIFCGRLISLKGPIYALQIFSKILNKTNVPLSLTIIGAGSLLQEVEEFIKYKGISKFVTLVGSISHDEIVKYYKEADIFIYTGISDPLTSRQEVQGLVIQEAQSMELPVVCFDVGGVKYGLIHQLTGFLVEEKNIGKFNEVLLKLINNNELRKEMGKSARKFIVENFNQSKLNNELLRIYFKYIS